MKLRPPASPLHVLWTPLPKQQLALECPADDILFGGAVGGGKTDFLLADWVQHAQQYGQNAVGLIARRTLPELRDIAKRAHKLFPKLGATWRASERTWVFTGGATLLFAYLETLEDATRYNGQEFTWVGIDEAGGFRTPEPIDYLRSRMRSPVAGIRKRMVLTANPGGRGHKWLLERYVKNRTPYVPFEATAPDSGEPLGFTRVYIPSRLTDNKFLMADRSYIGSIKASGPSWFVKSILLGDWNVAITGKVFMRSWFDKRFEPVPADHQDPRAWAEQKLGVFHVVQSWDFAARAKETNDRSVCTTWGLTPKGWLLLDVWADRLLFPDLKRKAVDLAGKWRCYEVLIEDASSGIGIIDELKRDTLLAIKPVKPKGDKYSRAMSVSALVEQGLVQLPKLATWLSDFLDEVCGFPEAAHDDIVDSISQALAHIAAGYTVGESDTPAFVPDGRPSAAKKDDFYSPPADQGDYAMDGPEDAWASRNSTH